MEDVA